MESSQTFSVYLPEIIDNIIFIEIIIFTLNVEIIS